MKIVNIILGTLFLALGILGIFLPLLPTTPFLLLTAWFYMRGSKRLYGWLLSNRYMGHYLRSYREKKSITMPAKAMSLTLMWAAMLFCIFYVVDALWMRILLGSVLVGVTAHILSFRTVRSSDIVRMRKVRSRREIKTVAALAEEIWHEYYPSLSSREQIDYMLDRFQSVHAITRQIEGKEAEYHLIFAGKEVIGYTGIKAVGDKLMLSKFYILKCRRGAGYSREVFEFLNNICLRKGLRAIWLTVNKGNAASIELYKRRGFRITEEKVFDIGGGFVMDDYIMEKEIGV